MKFKNSDVLFRETLEKVKATLSRDEDIDTIIGIPFYNETKTIKNVIEKIQESETFKKGQKLILCVGDPQGQATLESIESTYGNDVLCFLMPEGAKGRGYSIRAILELARFFEADVVLLEADLQSCGDRGIKPRWVDKLIMPITGNYDMAVASFRRHPFEDIIGNVLVSPLIRALYGMNFKDPLSGVFAISRELIEELCQEFDTSTQEPQGYGFNPWLITTTVKWEKKICEVSLGAKMSPVSFGKKYIVFKEMLRTLFSCIRRDEESWLNNSHVIKSPDVFGGEARDLPLEIMCNEMNLAESFRAKYYHYLPFLETILNQEILEWLGSMAEDREKMSFCPELWSKVAYQFLCAYTFNHDAAPEETLEMFMSIFDGMVAGFICEIKELKKFLKDESIDSDAVISAKAAKIFEDSVALFLEGKIEFIYEWEQRANETRPVLIPLDYLEFIPGVPIVLPKSLMGSGGKQINTGLIFKRLQEKYNNAFGEFIKTLGNENISSAQKIGEKLKGFMLELENTIDSLCPGNLYTEEGTLQVIDALFDIFPHNRISAVKAEILKKLIYEYPPSNLILRMGYKSLRELLENIDVRDVLTLAQFTEDKDYFDRIFYWLQDNLRPDSFEEVDLMPMVVSRNNFHGSGELREISDFNRLTARIPIMNLGKGMGGEYPKLRYFTRITKSIVEAEHFSGLWQTFARERKEVGRKFVNSILGHYGKAMFSAHHIFENWHHRVLVSKLQALATTLERQNKKDHARNIQIMTQGYGLSLVLDDGTFIPCSAWTWASFSFKGGDGIPTPLFLHIERDWFNHDLLEEIYREMGYNPQDILLQVFQFISQGRESIDLAKVLLGAKPLKEEVVIQEFDYWPKAKMLRRYDEVPLMDPIPEHSWENRYVLNTAAFRLGDKVYLLYRAYGEDQISRIGLAITDGYRVIERLREPIFVPEIEEEKKGCEDPRTVIIDDEVFMLYTAYDGVVAQIAAASISVKDFVEKRFDRWVRRGLAFPGLWDKDAILFPEKINDTYVIYHRIEPSIWTAYSNTLKFPWPKDGHKIIMGPRSGLMWDSLKIGAGAQPIKTCFGWLLIYHGVDQQMAYRLGVMVADLQDPGRLLYRSPNPILSPETECEIGKKDECWVPNVVFTCGAVPAVDKEMLDENDEILVYYGAADTNICLAIGTVGELVPVEIRKRNDCRIKV